MKTILNINLTDNQYKNLVATVMYNTRRAWEADKKGDHANGVLSGIGRVSCQLLYNIYKDDPTLDLALSPETISAINFVNNCIQVSGEDCKSFINSYPKPYVKPYSVTIFGMEMSKKEAESIFKNLINELFKED